MKTGGAVPSLGASCRRRRSRRRRPRGLEEPTRSRAIGVLHDNVDARRRNDTLSSRSGAPQSSGSFSPLATDEVLSAPGTGRLVRRHDFVASVASTRSPALPGELVEGVEAVA